MFNTPANFTETWIRRHAPDLLTGSLASRIAPFVRDNDLNGLAHFLQQCVTNERQSVPAWEKEQVQERLHSEAFVLKQLLQKIEQLKQENSIPRKQELKQRP